MTITRTITAVTAIAIGAAATIATQPAVYAATPAKAPAAAQQREVCAPQTYVKPRPDAVMIGSVAKGEKVAVQRYSRSGHWAKIVARRPTFTTRGWVSVADLCAKDKHAEFAKTSRYSARIANSRAGGDPGYLYVGGPANITVKDNEHAGQALTLCITPAPEERPSCRRGITGRTMDTIVWSKGGPTEVRITIDGGPVLVDTVYPWAIPVGKAPR
jgi:hypothetical protein